MSNGVANHPKLLVRSAPKTSAPDLPSAAEPDPIVVAPASEPDLAEAEQVSDAIAEEDISPNPLASENALPVVGWLVVVDGPGKGQFAPLFEGLNDIGRGPNQSVQLDFGDDKISTDSHAILVYEPKELMFMLNHAGQRSIVRHNGTAVLAPVSLSNGDQIELGDTTLRFAAFCGEGFGWSEVSE